jgi:Protein of unknown function (DUF3828)
MKRIAALISVAAVLLVPAQVRAAEPAATPEDCIRNFYNWYVTNLVANRDPMKQHKEIRQYATERLLREIRKMQKGPEGLDYDYFVNAQEVDPQWAKNISISNVQTKGDKSSALVLLNSSKETQVKLLVHLVKEGAAWKVDKVQGQD